VNFERIVFDLQGVTILDIDHLLTFFNIVKGDLVESFYLCDAELARLFLEKNLNAECLFESEHQMISHLRTRINASRCFVELPPRLNLESFQTALKDFASDENLARSDIVVFNMKSVLEADFQTLSMFAPTIHSIAHLHGTLASITNARRKIVRSFEEHGTFRVIVPYLTEPVGIVPAITDLGGIMPMHAFTYEELVEIQDYFQKRNEIMFVNFREWVGDVAGVTHTDHLSLSRKEALHVRYAQLFSDLRQIVKELAENVAVHSHGLGYLAMRLAQNDGLRIYVGDTGIGLARGLRLQYQLSVRNDAHAVELAFSLKNFRDKRRRDRGSIFVSGGRGLEKVRLILEHFGGEIIVRSGTAMATFNPRNCRTPTVVSSRLYNILGTHLHVFIPTRHL
jgi:hypothetical protein